MGFLGFNKKKKVPDELPDLISDDIEKESKEVHDFLKEEEKKVQGVDEKKEVVEQKNKDLEEELENNARKELALEKERQKQNTSKEIVSRLVKNINDTPQIQEKKDFDSEKSFFDELQGSLGGEIEDLDKLEDWYEKKFLPRDVLSDMRSYWENQKTTSVLKILGKNFQLKITDKLSHLQELEKGWQNAYFEMVEKEEEIKEQEKELKQLLREFVEICKSKKKTLEEGDMGKKGIKKK